MIADDSDDDESLRGSSQGARASLLAGYDDKDGDVDDNTREFKLHVYGKRQTSDSS